MTGEFDSAALGVSKAYKVYLPDGYESTDRRYPVLYLLHGLGVGEEAWTSATLDVAGTADRLDFPALIVMPDGDRGYYVNGRTPPNYERCFANTMPKKNRSEPRASFCVRHANYETYIVRDLIGYVDSRFRTVPKRRARAIAGESGGGYGAMMLAFRHPDLFGSVAAHSGFFSLLYLGPHPYRRGKVRLRESIAPGRTDPEQLSIFGTEFSNWLAHDPVSLAERLQDDVPAIYFDVGTEDPNGFADQARYFHDRLTALGIAHHFEAVPGGHNETLWKERIAHSLCFHKEAFRRAGLTGDETGR